MKKVMFEEPFLVCHLDEEVPVLSHFWKSHPKKDEFTATLIRMVGLFKEIKKHHPNLTWCGDTTNLGVLSIDTQNWLSENWTKYLLDAGVEYHALIVPKDVFGRHAMKKFKTTMEDKHKEEIVMEQFMDEKTAFDWLSNSIKVA